MASYREGIGLSHALVNATDTFMLELWGALAGVQVMKRKLKHGPAITTVNGAPLPTFVSRTRNGNGRSRANRRENFLHRNPIINEALKLICNEWGVTLDELHGRHRFRHVVAVRKATAFLLRDVFQLSYPEIAFAMHYLHHASVMSSESQAIELIERDTTFAAKVRTARQQINELKRAEEQNAQSNI